MPQNGGEIMKKKFLSVLLTAAVLLAGAVSTGCQSKENGTEAGSDGAKREIVVATSANPRPYTYEETDGTLTGYNIELTKELFELLPQYSLRFEVTEFDSCLTGLTSGTYQIVANNLGFKDERAELFIYAGPLNKATKVVALRNGLTGINSLLDLSGYVTEGEPQINETGLIEAYFAAHPEVDFTLNYTEKQTGAQYQDLYDGTIDYLFTNLASFNSYTEEFGYDFEYYVLSDEENDEYSGFLEHPYVYYCLGPDEAELAKDIKEAMIEFKNSGKWGELTIEWFGEDVSPTLEEIGYWDLVVR